MSWTCPECERVFARNKQAHSCESYPLDPLFFKSAKGVRELYDLLLARIKVFGPIDIRVGPYNVSVRNLSTFMSIMPERDHLTIVFLRSELLDEFPIYQSHKQSSKRWANYVKIESPEEINHQLIAWLKDAYEITSGD